MLYIWTEFDWGKDDVCMCDYVRNTRVREKASAAQQDCFECIDWKVFEDASTQNRHTSHEEEASSLTPDCSWANMLMMPWSPRSEQIVFATRQQMRALRQGSKQQAGIKGKICVCSATSFSHCPPMTAVRGCAQDSIVQCQRHQQTARGAHIGKGNHQCGREVHGEQSAAPCQQKEGADCWF